MKRLTVLQTACALASLLMLAACTQDEQADGTRLAEGQYPLELTAAGLQAVATPTGASTRATVDGDWEGAQNVAVEVGRTVKQYKVTPDASNKAIATLSAANGVIPFYWQSTANITVSAWYVGTGEYRETLPNAWSVQSNQSEKENGIDNYQRSDFLYAPPTGIAFSNETKALTFYHQTARVVINIVNGEAATDANAIQKVVIGDANNLALSGNYAAPTSSGATAGTWTPASSGMGTIKTKKLATPNKLSDGQATALVSYAALVIPQTVTAKQNFISVTVNGTTYYYKAENGKNTLQAGHVHTYNITVMKTELKVTTPSPSSQWGEGSNENVIGQEI